MCNINQTIAPIYVPHYFQMNEESLTSGLYDVIYKSRVFNHLQCNVITAFVSRVLAIAAISLAVLFDLTISFFEPNRKYLRGNDQIAVLVQPIIALFTLTIYGKLPLRKHTIDYLSPDLENELNKIKPDFSLFSTDQIFAICQRDFIRYAERLKNSGFDMNTQDAYGNTFLHRYLQSHCENPSEPVLDTVKEMLKSINPNIKNHESQTALHVALNKRLDPRFVKILLDHKADPNLADRFDLTPLHYILIGKSQITVFGGYYSEKNAKEEGIFKNVNEREIQMANLLIDHGAIVWESDIKLLESFPDLFKNSDQITTYKAFVNWFYSHENLRIDELILYDGIISTVFENISRQWTEKLKSTEIIENPLKKYLRPHAPPMFQFRIQKPSTSTYLANRCEHLIPLIWKKYTEVNAITKSNRVAAINVAQITPEFPTRDLPNLVSDFCS